MDHNSSLEGPAEAITSFLDTDLYKLTMQCAVYKFYRDVEVEYAFTNRTPEKRLTRDAFNWLVELVNRLSHITLRNDERRYLQENCPYLDEDYLDFLASFHFNPQRQVTFTFTPVAETNPKGTTDAERELGDVRIDIKGKWVDTILYEIPVLAMTSQAYFQKVDTDWDSEGQVERAKEKGLRLLEAGCDFSEFGTRRRRSYHTQSLVFKGLREASKVAKEKKLPGRFLGTSNVHLAMRFGIPPIGTVAHEWFMGIAAITNDYPGATEEALRRWVGAFGDQLSVALTDTFGTPAFLRAFDKPVEQVDGGVSLRARPGVFKTEDGGRFKTYAELFTGVRQDSGDPHAFVETMHRFYNDRGIEDKTVVFSDSLNVDRCLEYKKLADDAGLKAMFGVGTFLTNDFMWKEKEGKSAPMNIVIKLSKAEGRPAVKISDNAGKNTGDKATIQRVKQELDYTEREWDEGDETARWGAGEAKAPAEEKPIN